MSRLSKKKRDSMESINGSMFKSSANAQSSRAVKLLPTLRAWQLVAARAQHCTRVGTAKALLPRMAPKLTGSRKRHATDCIGTDK